MVPAAFDGEGDAQGDGDGEAGDTGTGDTAVGATAVGRGCCCRCARAGDTRCGASGAGVGCGCTGCAGCGAGGVGCTTGCACCGASCVGCAGCADGAGGSAGWATFAAGRRGGLCRRGRPAGSDDADDGGTLCQRHFGAVQQQYGSGANAVDGQSVCTTRVFQEPTIVGKGDASMMVRYVRVVNHQIAIRRTPDGRGTCRIGGIGGGSVVNSKGRWHWFRLPCSSISLHTDVLRPHYPR